MARLQGAVCALVLLAQAGAARADPSGLLRFEGKRVELQRIDGQREQVQVLQVGLCAIVVKRADGTVAKISLIRVQWLRLVGDHSTAARFDPVPPVLLCPVTKLKKPGPRPRRFRVFLEVATLRFQIGTVLEFGFFDSQAGHPREWWLNIGGEVALFTLRWKHVYWEILRGGCLWALMPYWGSAIGYPFRFDSRGRHELRVGAHLSMWLGMFPSMSGVQIHYVLRLHRWFALQFGIQQFSWPFSLVANVGCSF